jgi:hypothetical protein
VLETEGGSGGKEDHAYHVVEALAVAYDGRQLPGVLTLTVSPNVKARLKVCGSGCEGLRATCIRGPVWHVRGTHVTGHKAANSASSDMVMRSRAPLFLCRTFPK